jgi:CBS domain-containing protein
VHTGEQPSSAAAVRGLRADIDLTGDHDGGRHIDVFRPSIGLGLLTVLIASLGVVITGYLHAQLMTEQQPTKMAAAEALYDTVAPASTGLPAVLLPRDTPDSPPWSGSRPPAWRRSPRPPHRCAEDDSTTTSASNNRALDGTKGPPRRLRTPLPAGANRDEPGNQRCWFAPAPTRPAEAGDLMTSTTRLNAQPEAADDEPLVRRDMTGNVVAIVADADLLIASRIMAARRVRHLPVMEGPRCLGLLLEIDVLQALALADNPLVRPPLLAGELCRTAPVVRPDDHRSTAARQMRATGIDAALVCEGEAVVGILTATDLIRSLASEAGTDPTD